MGLKLSKNQQTFFSLVRTGLWEKESALSSIGEIDFIEVYRKAREQSVVGLVAAGIEHLKDVDVPKEKMLAFASTAMQLEQMNLSMNAFIEVLINRMRKAGIYAILVKGQGIAQCYEKPLWRACGDIDLLLSGNDYKKAKQWFDSLGSVVLEENRYRKRIEYAVESWNVELHGTMRGDIKNSIDRVIDEAQADVFMAGNVRAWDNNKTTIFLPSADNDVIFVFTHIIQHFFKEGIGLRQICDWCRLLWTYRTEIDVVLLEKRLRAARIMTEWRAFAAFAVDWLGMPVEVMPLYDSSRKWSRKAERIVEYVLEVGNFGHNRDKEYKAKSSFAKRMVISFGRRAQDFSRQVRIFPIDAMVAFGRLMKTGLAFAWKSMTQRK